jgi:hypothetical protein
VCVHVSGRLDLLDERHRSIDQSGPKEANRRNTTLDLAHFAVARGAAGSPELQSCSKKGKRHEHRGPTLLAGDFIVVVIIAPKSEEDTSDDQNALRLLLAARTHKQQLLLCTA